MTAYHQWQQHLEEAGCECLCVCVRGATPVGTLWVCELVAAWISTSCDTKGLVSPGWTGGLKTLAACGYKGDHSMLPECVCCIFNTPEACKPMSPPSWRSADNTRRC